MRVIGLMSGTSLDGIDAALIEIDGDARETEWRLVAFVSIPYEDTQRASIQRAIEAGSAHAVCRLNAELGEWFAAAALAVCASAAIAPEHVDLIGSHGQTLWHDPPTGARRGSTLQVGCAATIAERTGIPVVSDFRARDVAAGGEGAPLVPWVDRRLFTRRGRSRVLQNIGGMANLTWLPPAGAESPLLAFDTGPGNALIDAAVEAATDGRHCFDRDGAWASSAEPDGALLAELLAHPYLEREPPKSTGRELFGRPFVAALIERRVPASREDWAVLIATLTAFTARSIADAVVRWVLPRGVDEVVVTGGGARNPALMGMLREWLPVPVLDGDVLGLDPEAKEAVAFAALAWAHVRGIPANESTATGAEGARVLGSFTPGDVERPLPFRTSAAAGEAGA
jgi:anhydro-N-acetylmuramic acid kinase